MYGRCGWVPFILITHHPCGEYNAESMSRTVDIREITNKKREEFSSELKRCLQVYKN